VAGRLRRGQSVVQALQSLEDLDGVNLGEPTAGRRLPPNGGHLRCKKVMSETMSETVSECRPRRRSRHQIASGNSSPSWGGIS